MTNDDKARVYDDLLREHDEKARLVSLIQSKFDLTRDDNAEITKLKKEMDVIQNKAASLGSL